ncbi:DNA-binding protein [Parabacteroides distasonis]|nr:DNA-binding protein [Parabacteroides distasonis]
MIRYLLRQNTNEMSSAFGKYYAYPVVEETMDLQALAAHMEEHNTGFSEAMCVGVMKAMVKCIKEMLLAGKNVKIDNLAIFSVGIRNKQGAVSPEMFTVANNIDGVKLRARATGTLSNANLNLAASLKRAVSYSNGNNPSGGNTTDNPGEENPTMYTLTLTASPAEGGTVSGAGQYEAGTAASIQATANSGYTFTRWSDGDTNATRSVTVNNDLTLTAEFASESGGTDPEEPPFS